MSRLAPFTHHAIVCTVAVLTVLPLNLQAFELPECGQLEQWAAKLEPDRTFALAPEVEITTLLQDDLTTPLVGKPVSDWTRQELSSLRRQIAQCRKQAHKRKDQAKTDQLYAALKALDASRAPLTRLQQIRTRTGQTVDRLLKYRPSQRLAGQLALSQDALRGKAIDPGAYELRQVPNWIPQLQQAPGYLDKKEIDRFVAMLGQRRDEMQQQFQAADDAYAKARKELAEVPMTQAGLATLSKLERSPVLKEVSPAEIDQFRAEINRKRSAIQASLRRQEQARQITTQRQTGAQPRASSQAAATLGPVDIGKRLEQLLQGDDVDEVQLIGLTPNMPHQQAVRHVKSRLGYQETLSLSMTQAHGKGATLIQFREMDQQVGELDLTERFKGPLDIDAAIQSLKERFGSPDNVEPVPGGQMMTWRDGDRILQVLATNRVHNLAAHTGYRSRLSIGLWSEDYEAYLVDLNQRCDELRDKPRSDLSMNEAVYLGTKCPLMPGQYKTAGVIKVM
ncbi:MAG: hypothetical protein OQL28_07730 [Sedimenticola sp.]|nr:hypothetical protein [Sedimenticola sp.]